MKRAILFLSIVLMSFVSLAQDTLRSQDLPSSGDIYLLSSGSSFTGMDALATGPNHTWDFRQINYISQRYDTMLDPANTNPLLGFFFINSSFNINRANLAANAANFNLGLVNVTGVYNYYYNTSSEFRQPGFGAVISGVPLPVAYSPHDVLYRFPMTYGNQDSVSYFYEVDLTSTLGLYYNVRRTRHNEVDGWGTMQTPFGTFSVLRVNSTITEQDSIYVDSLNLGLKTPPIVTHEYKWMAKTFGLPLLQINTNASGGILQILYQDSMRTIGIDEPLISLSALEVFPNPAHETIQAKIHLKNPAEVMCIVFSSDGRIVYDRNFKNLPVGTSTLPIDVSDWASGFYTISVESGRGRMTEIFQVVGKN